MPQPEAEPTTRDAVKLHLKITDTADDEALTVIVAAVNDWVRGLRVADVDADEWPPRVALGALMLGGRLHRRRASPAGIESFGVDGAVYVNRNDPDIGMMLGIGRNAKPVAR